MKFSRNTLRALGKKILLTFALFLVLFIGVNWNTITNVATPPVKEIITSIKGSEQVPQYDTSKNVFYYPRLGIEAPLTVSANTSPLDSQDWNSIKEALTKGVSVNYGGDEFSKTQLAYLTGHSSDTYPHPYSSVFAALGQAKIDDQFVVTEEGKVWNYRVISKKVVDPRNLLSFSAGVIGAQEVGKQHVALVTCWPLLTTLNRMVIVGERVAQ